MKAVADPNAEHGSAARARAGCTCESCAKALTKAEAAQRYREHGPVGRARRNVVLNGNRTHGLISTYVRGCGCPECREAGRRYRAKYPR